MGFLIDTNVLAELRKGQRGDPGVRHWYDTVDESSLYVSVHDLTLVTRNTRDMDRTGASLLNPFSS